MAKAQRHKGKILLLNQAECLGTIASNFQCKLLERKDIQPALESACFENNEIKPVYQLVKPGESVCIVVSDHTRRTAADLILPVLLQGLRSRGCSLADVFILFASGIHRHPAPQEIEKILGTEITRDFSGRIFLHDPDDRNELVSVGSPVFAQASPRRAEAGIAAGQEVFLNRKAVEADRLVLIGAGMFHYHAGFGGGRKSIVPGMADRATIAYTHSLTIDPVEDRIRDGVAIGKMDGNPVSEAMLACARLCEPDFIINTVLTSEGKNGKLAGVFAGEMDIAHRQACRLVEKISRVNISQPADFVIASAGSATNWIQSHKAFYNAHRAIHGNGRVILDAKCPEGIGNERFRYWVTKRNVAEIYAGLRQSPEVLGQTALSTRARAPRTVLVTQMNQADLADLGMRSADNLDSAVRIVLDDLASTGIKKPSYYVMPDAMCAVPFL